jgi:hypothetical protein
MSKLGFKYVAVPTTSGWHLQGGIRALLQKLFEALRSLFTFVHREIGTISK